MPLLLIADSTARGPAVRIEGLFGGGNSITDPFDGIEDGGYALLTHQRASERARKRERSKVKEGCDYEYGTGTVADMRNERRPDINASRLSHIYRTPTTAKYKTRREIDR